MSEYKKEEWRVKQPAADIRALAERFSISPILAHIIVNREITEPDAVACYLSDDLAYTHDPALMKDMDKGCQIMKDSGRKENPYYLRLRCRWHHIELYSVSRAAKGRGRCLL